MTTSNIDHQNLTLTRGDMAAVRQLLTEQRTRRLDVVASHEALYFENGLLRIRGCDPVIGDDGVTEVNGTYRPTQTFDSTLADKLGLRARPVREWRAENRTELIDFAFGHYLHGSCDRSNPPYDKRLFLRLWTGENGGGIARAALSDKFKPVDNLEVLVSALDGMADAGLGPENIGRCDISETRMFVQVSAPQVRALAPLLLKGYRSPYTGKLADDNPVVFAGFVISNNELGGGALTITPRITVEVCNNGATYSQDAIRRVHLGSQHDEGVVEYAADTVQKELELAKLRTRDAVKTFLTPEYLEGKIRQLEAQGGVEISNPTETIKAVVSENKIPPALADDVFNKFLKGGQPTAAGVMQAVTAVAQDQDDAELGYELEDKAPAVLASAARLA